MKKKIVILFLLLVFISLVLIQASFNVNDSMVIKDIQISNFIINLHQKNYTREEFENRLKKLEVNKKIKLSIQDYYNMLSTDEIKISIDDIKKRYIDKNMNNEYLSISNDNINSKYIYTLENERNIPLIELKDKRYIKTNNELLEIVDIYSLLCYNNIDNSVRSSWLYSSKKINKNIVTIEFLNTKTNQCGYIEYKHGVLGRLKELKVSIDA